VANVTDKKYANGYVNIIIFDAVDETNSVSYFLTILYNYM